MSADSTTVARTWKGSTKQGRAVIDEVLRMAAYVYQNRIDCIAGTVSPAERITAEHARRVIQADLRGAKLFEMKDGITWVYTWGNEQRVTRYWIDTTGSFIYATEEKA